MDLHNAAALLTTHAQHAYTLQREAGAALTLGTQSDPRRLARLAHRAERVVELAVLWDGVLWEAHGTGQRNLFPLADPARLVAAARTLRTLTRDGITRAYDLTCEEFPDLAPSARPGTGRHGSSCSTPTSSITCPALRRPPPFSPSYAPACPTAPTTYCSRPEPRPRWSWSPPCVRGSTPHRWPPATSRPARARSSSVRWNARRSRGAASPPRAPTARPYSSPWSTVVHHPSPDTADDCLADSAACVRNLAQWRAENQAKGPVQG
ncbi:hypothetical protein ABZ759_29655 [Streptomyces sp. NPDC047860]|uniref:hypothetical protein n=1 Tax=Streptomyces sp. NPDC047860 TaxID=3155743 RepID=UPI0033D8E8E5